MKARLVENKIPAALKIYRFPDGTHEATRDGFLYTFLWKPYKVYNLKKIGGIGPSWIPQGRLFRNPPVQMILQVQNGINNLNESVLDIFESLTDTLKPKTLTSYSKEAFEIIMPDLESVGFNPRNPRFYRGILQIPFIPLDNTWSCEVVYKDLEIMKDVWQEHIYEDSILNEWYAILRLGKGHGNVPPGIEVKSNDGTWKSLFMNILIKSFEDDSIDERISSLQNEINISEDRLNKLKTLKTNLVNANKIINEKD